MIKRIYVNDIIPNKIYGSDKYMSNFDKANIYCCGRFFFNCNYKKMKEFIDKTRINVINYIKNNDDIFLYNDLNKKKILINKNLKINDIFFESDLNFYEERIREDHFKKGIFYTYSYKNKKFYIFMDHALYDFIGMYKFVNLFHCKINDPNDKRIEYNYKPIIYELYYFFNLIKLLKIKKYNDKPKQIIKSNHIIKFDKKIIESIKNKFNFKSTDISLGISIYHIFNSSNIKNFNVGILFSLFNPRFRNNYTILPISIKKDNLINIINQITKQKKKNKFLSIMFYDGANYYFPSNQTTFKLSIDCFYTNMYNNNEKYNEYFELTDFLTNSCLNFYITSTSDKFNKYNYIAYEYTKGITDEKLFRIDEIDNIL